MTKLLLILSVLSSFLANLETKTLQSEFTVSVAEDAVSPLNYPGEITMRGDRFLLDMFGIEAAYDGKTLYMYHGDVDELTLSNPTEQELIEANPFLYAKALVEVCNITERPTTNDKLPTTLITLTPKDQSIGINRFVLKVRNSDLVPLSVEIKEGKKTSTLRMTAPKFTDIQPQYTIVPNKDTYVNDLRF